MFVTAQDSVYSQFKRALERRNFMLAWTMAAELPKVPLADGLELLLLARDLEPARFDRAVPRWHARLCSEQRLSGGEAQLALAALNALPGPGVNSAVQSLAALCEAHGLGQEVRVLEPGSRLERRVPRRKREKSGVWSGTAALLCSLDGERQCKGCPDAASASVKSIEVVQPALDSCRGHPCRTGGRPCASAFVPLAWPPPLPRWW